MVHCLRIDLWDDKWDTLIHSECRTIVNDDTTLRNCNRSKFLAYGSTCTQKGDVYITKTILIKLFYAVMDRYGIDIRQGHVIDMIGT